MLIPLQLPVRINMNITNIFKKKLVDICKQVLKWTPDLEADGNKEGGVSEIRLN